MPCRHFTVRGPDGKPLVNAIICGPKPRRRKCSACAAPASALRQCDWITARAADGTTISTCDAWLCDSCTMQPAPEKDLCPQHADEWEAMKARRATKVPVDINAPNAEVM